jgi:hypothetical protein
MEAFTRTLVIGWMYAFVIIHGSREATVICPLSASFVYPGHLDRITGREWQPWLDTPQTDSL